MLAHVIDLEEAAAKVTAHMKLQPERAQKVDINNPTHLQRALVGLASATAQQQLLNGLGAHSDHADYLRGAASTAAKAVFDPQAGVLGHVQPFNPRDANLFFGLRLLIPVFQDGSACTECERPLDRYGHHAFICRGKPIAEHLGCHPTSMWTKRHNDVVKALVHGISDFTPHSAVG